MSMQTVFIGLDGATFTVLDPLIQDGVMPFLRQFIASGSRAQLRTVIPALTPPAWASLVTGCSPGQHGIFDFFRKEAPQSHNFRFVTSRDISVQESIWSLANQHGRRVIALNFPLTFPAPAIEGYVVPGWMPWRQLRLGCHPKNLYNRIKALPGFEPRELAMDMVYEEKALEGCAPEEFEDWIAFHARREQQWLQILTMLLDEENSCELVSILFDGVDKLQHLCWRFLDPAYSYTLQADWEWRVRECCLDYFRQLDQVIARIVAKVGDEATVILASDHGFGAQERTFFVNTWLAQQGYLAWKDNSGLQPSPSQRLGVGQIARHGYLLNWERTVAYAPLPSGNGLHIVRKDDAHPYGVTEEDYESLRTQLIADLGALLDPITGIPVVAQIWKREEIFAGPHTELAPDLTLVLQDGGLISILNSSEVVRPQLQVSGTHRPEGIFIARGPGICSGACLQDLSILDIAPLVLYSMSLPIPAVMEGSVPIEALKAPFQQPRPPTIGKAPAQRNTQYAHPVVQPALDDESEAILMQRLRALGYVQ